MRLADLIAREGAKRPASDYGRLAAAVSGSQRFELEPAAKQMMSVLAFHSPGSRLKAAMPLSRMPFGSMWVEWIGGSAEGAPELQEPDSGSLPPIRCGLLFEAIDAGLQRGMITLAWSFRRNGAEVLDLSPLCATFDWSAAKRAPPTILPTPTEGELRSQSSRLYRSMSDDELFDINSRVGIIENPRARDAAAALVRMRNEDFPRFSKAQSDLFRDWSGEVSFAQSVLVCLNSKNMTSIKEGDDLSALNRARARVGKLPLLAFSRVRINLSAIMQRKVGTDPTGAQLRAHIVRGHFKVRKTGIFWWSPFMRGNSEIGVVARTGYQVGAST